MGAGGIVVLGLDPGSRCTGYGLVCEVSGQVSLLEAGTIRTERETDVAARLGLIYSGVAALIERHGPSEAAVESVFVAVNSASAIKLGQARGAALAACGVAGVPVFAYEPTLVKKSLVGAGRADKSQVAFMVGRVLGCREAMAKDASDALAVAVCHLNRKRFLKLCGAS
ncbi:crossover junction endodeoxyribonuclease RuvC [Desulfovibrio sulfodismutans]|uniref:Crossover junction endodeoxyribonuclease RuvC n=1 Tax=Desulfolutivibrio sulfodismutans TaxID=63561 RepID=A0A7K3NMU4_9BACT|nr:crossover junction endodeoxyribonuclease RuvC [Desulfolutivibrio sulfodismutans]NDY57522.1 crossover junction endodeoxyribonuclease RuvC [Desulfolutivibrio sulfodismutans]QLA14346.1 crossover junction endodeoxyribonuclease RuvC [Desulfolutivibrio sulfodismutans DSM 3696]